MIVEKSALLLAKQIKKYAPNHDASLDVLEFSLKILINILFVIFLTIASSLAFNLSVTNALKSAFGFALLRSVSGGYHLKSSDLCVIASCSVLILIQFISSIPYLNYLNIISIILIIILSPRDMQVQSKIPQKFNVSLKFIGLTIVLLNMWLLKSNILTSAFLLQTLTLLFKNKQDDAEE